MTYIPSIRKYWLLAGAIFFVSGALALVYQVLWVRMLSLFFGSDIYAATITLAIFMGGLSLGSWIAGRIGDRIGRPVVVFGACEIIMALSGLAIPYFLHIFFPIYRDVYSSFDSSAWLYHLFRISVALVLLVPTVCMGMTLPLFVRAFARDIKEFGRDIARLYAINLAGAFVGTLVAGFVLLPFLGVMLTLYITVGTGLCIGIASIVIGRNMISAPRNDFASLPQQVLKNRNIVIFAMLISGAAALALEIVWMRVLLQFFSATAYAFSIMLACFLFGLFIGSALVAKIVDKQKEPLRFLFFLQVALGVSVALVAALGHFVPAGLGHVTTALGSLNISQNAASILARFFVLVAQIITPTILLGASFPFAVRAYTTNIEQRSLATGKIYAANTIGAILGVLAAGFILLPLLGTIASLFIIAFVFVLNGLIIEVREWFVTRKLSPWSLRIGAFGFGIIAIFAAITIALPHPPDFRQGIDPYALARIGNPPDILYHKDGALSTVAVIKDINDGRMLLINGVIVVSASNDQKKNQSLQLQSLLPLLLAENPTDVAIVGLGIGITANAAAQYPTVKRVRIVELSPEVAAAQKYLTDINSDILNNPKVHFRVDDARNFMSMTGETFDMVTTDPVHPVVAGQGYLYSKEYYVSIKAHLRDSGVVLQWLPIANLSPESFDVALRTFFEVFPNSTVWYAFNRITVVGKKSATTIDCSQLAKNLNSAVVKSSFPFLDTFTMDQLLGSLLMGPSQVERYLARNSATDINTDDNLYLEYHIPWELPQKQSDIILHGLAQYAGWDATQVFAPNCSAKTIENARAYLNSQVYGM